MRIGEIIFCSLNAPGSWHDSRVAANIYRKLIEDTPENHFLIADTAFPRTLQSIQGRIHAPMKQGEKLPDNPRDRAKALALNADLVNCRQAAEWGMRAIQGSFGRLKIPLPISNEKRRKTLLQVVFRLHQVRVQLVGINQIQTVYTKIWQSESDLLAKDIGEMLFSNIRKSDRVSRFHLVNDDT